MISYSDLRLSPAETFTGYEYGNHKDTEATLTAIKDYRSRKLGQVLLRDVDIPDEVDFTWHIQEHQMRQGSCQGHSLTSCLEGCFWIDTGGSRPPQLSRNFAYRASQLIDDISGDNGSTLAGGVEAAYMGICDEHWFPYTEAYSRRIPDEAFNHREEFRLRLAVPIDIEAPSTQVVNWIGEGKGFCAIGMKWTSEMDSQPIIDNYRGKGSAGGHAVCFLGYSLSKQCLYLVNSWGHSWGENGVKQVSFRAFDKIMRYNWNMGYLYSDLHDIEETRDIPDFSIITDIIEP